MDDSEALERVTDVLRLFSNLLGLLAACLFSNLLGLLAAFLLSAGVQMWHDGNRIAGAAVCFICSVFVGCLVYIG